MPVFFDALKYFLWSAINIRLAWYLFLILSFWDFAVTGAYFYMLFMELLSQNLQQFVILLYPILYWKNLLLKTYVIFKEIINWLTQK